jgi:hypothetical protein
LAASVVRARRHRNILYASIVALEDQVR